jgi:hypothetical protein
MFDQEREQNRRTYELCRLGFGITGFALVLASFTCVVALLGYFQRDLAMWIGRQPWYQWLDTPIVWGSLIGATLLWGSWNQVSWQQRAGMLLVMCLGDLAIWFVLRGFLEGLPVKNGAYAWLCRSFGDVLGWGEFALLSSLSCGYLVHLGIEGASDSDKSIRSTIATGAMVWMLDFCQQTDWAAGWPLMARQRRWDGFLVYGSTLIWSITLFQVTALVISAARQSSLALSEMNREDLELDPLRSRSDSQDDFAAAASYRDRCEGLG